MCEHIKFNKVTLPLEYSKGFWDIFVFSWSAVWHVVSLCTSSQQRTSAIKIVNEKILNEAHLESIQNILYK